MKKQITVHGVRLNVNEKEGTFTIRRLTDFGTLVVNKRQLSGLRRLIEKLERHEYRGV